SRISAKKSFLYFIRVLCLLVVSFGVLTSIAGMDLGSLWDLSDFANILIAYCNIPLLYLGFSYVKRATDHFEKQDGTPFTSKEAGTEVPVWDEKAGK
ncbi:MAG: sodium:alanine symporter, partial [Lachnospiraceae bacterium]|nr:sodium:alanine symporter [Lachnospiraceae bacterium]